MSPVLNNKLAVVKQLKEGHMKALKVLKSENPFLGALWLHKTKTTAMLIVLALSFFIAGTAYAAINNGLVAYYPFVGNANDLSGYGNDGTVYGPTLTEDRFGNPKSSYLFDGTDDYIYISNSSSLTPEDEITVSAWVYLNSYKGSPETNNIVVKDDFDLDKRDYILHVGYWQDEYGIYNVPEFAVFTSSETGTETGTVKGGSIGKNKWHNIVGTYNGTSIDLYIDGSFTKSEAFTGALNNTDTPLLIGHTNHDLYDRFFHGKIGEIRIYERALSKPEIQELYYRFCLDYCYSQ